MKPRRSIVRRALASTLASALAALAVLACGSRGPLDIEVIEINGVDGATVDGAELDGATHDGSADSAPDVVSDGRADGGNPLVNCGQCLAQSCGQQVLACITDTNCRGVLQCVAQMCLGGGGTGGLNPQCALGCAGGDFTKLSGVIALFTCVTTKCGPDCASALGGLGGGGGGGRGG